MQSTVVMRGTGLPLREPDATCESCGARGTVGRAVRTDAHGEPLEIHRFCRACWPEERARFRAQWDEEARVSAERFHREPDAPAPVPAPAGYTLEGATWHGVLELVAELRLLAAPRQPISPEAIALMTAEWARLEQEWGEPIPMEIRAFLDAVRDGTG